MKRVTVFLKDRSYDICVGPGLLGLSGRIIGRLGIGDHAIIVANPTTRRLYAAALSRSLKKAGIASSVETVPDSEKAKSWAVAQRLISRISSVGGGKRLFLIALGGGVVGDVTGFAASIYKRGVPYVQIPTTLLAQVDSAIGGKTAIDMPSAKNLVGSFYQPSLVISDTAVLKTLDVKQIASGLAEAIKYGIIRDPRLLFYIERNIKKLLRADQRALENIVVRSSAIKAMYVEADERDTKGVRAALNFGHTIGHAIEAATGYKGTYEHGPSVAIGMAAASEISFWLGLLRIQDLRRIRSVISGASLPIAAPGLRVDSVMKSCLYDKKFRGAVNRFILPRRIGKVVIVEDVPEFAIRAVLSKLFSKHDKR